VSGHVVTVTLNPAVDKSLFCRGALTGDNVRAHAAVDVAGGKGVNVARGLKALDVPAVAIALLGGFPGRFVEALMAEEGLAARVVPIAGKTRHALTLLDEAGGQYLHALEPGPELSEAEAQQTIRVFAEEVQGASLAIVSGSVPQPEFAWLPGQLVATAHQAGVEPWLDASGEALTRGLPARPRLVKPNRAEAEALLGRPCCTLDDAIAAVDAIAAFGPKRVVLSLGAEGLVAHWEGERWAATSDSADERCAIGSGDALVAGMAAAYLRGASTAECLRMGAACGGANAEAWLPASFTREAAEAWLERVEVRRAP
jgi:tagatose 6-phosphate kinase